MARFAFVLQLALSLFVASTYSKPFEDQHMTGFPKDMPLPLASRDSATEPRIKPAVHYEPDAGPNTPDENFSIQLPFSQKCEQHVINAKENGAPIHHMEMNDVLAFYPMMNEQASHVTVVINIKDLSYKGTIDGSMIKINQCYNLQQMCESKGFQSTKGRDLINPQQWNYIYGALGDKEITLNVNNITKVTIKSDQTLEEMVGAEWYFMAEDLGENSLDSIDPAEDKQLPSWHYVAQYPCAEYIDARNNTKSHTSSHTGDKDDDPMSEINNNLLIGLIVGCVLLVIVTAIIVGVIIKGVKSRRSANISEGTPIKN